MKTIKEISSFEQCMKCTVCTVYCPVLAVNPDYPGPKQAGPDGERYRLKNPLFYDEALDMCLNCKRCEVNCPQNVKIGDIIQRARLEYGSKKPSLRDFALSHTDLMGSVATTVAPIANAALGWGITKSAMDGLFKIDRHRTFPKYAREKFTTWFRKNAEAKQAGYNKFVTFYHGCYANYNYPQLGKDFVTVLNAAGYGIHLIKDEKCCGVALISNGFAKDAAKNAGRNIANFKAATAKGEPVLTVSSTCTFTMRDEYGHILGIDTSDVRDNIVLVEKFLYKQLESGKIRLVFKKDYHKKVAYHTACHMEKLGWSIYSKALLRMIPGVELVELDSQCCGIAGTYGFKKEHYRDSQAIGSSLFDKIKASGAEVVATECETCKWQIEMSAGVPVDNPISIIASALDVEATVAANKA
ncbi:MAG: anaerobic glycerol-3-phosphate dehydrogenase subunit GlpC [Candidatus Cryptobacteroides sp.]